MVARRCVCVCDSCGAGSFVAARNAREASAIIS
jgi:hypothetical protein